MKSKTAAASLPPLPVAGRDHIEGRSGAPFVLLEYGDFQCPYCAEAYALVKLIRARLGDRLCFAYRNFPLIDKHPYAEHAAEAAEAAGAQGHFWKMHDALFENQPALADQDLAKYAEKLGLDANRLIEEVEEGAHQARIQEDFRGGLRNGVDGTPAFFVNGVAYDGELDAASLLDALME